MLRRFSVSTSVILGFSALSISLLSVLPATAQQRPSRRMHCTTTRSTTICHVFLRGRLISSEVTRNGRTKEIPRTSAQQRGTKSAEKFEPPKGGAPAETNGAGSRKGK